jgi:transcriptional regulator of acetoin/glycerol metabolism
MSAGTAYHDNLGDYFATNADTSPTTPHRRRGRRRQRNPTGLVIDCEGHKSAVTARLGISRATLYEKRRRCRIDVPATLAR